MKVNKRLNKTILEIVENQISQLDPPATKETFDRLVREGHDQDEALRLIGCVVTSEIFDILKNMEPYDEDRYVTALRRLPDLGEWE
jgi:peroxiredoxin family protein